MQDVEQIRTWSHPVIVRIGYGNPEAIRGPAEAVDCLEHRWPHNSGIYFDLAHRRCSAASSLTTSAEEARELFMSAAIEACVLE
jgi:hypothetical protein